MTTAGRELWKKIEAPQGYAFIADSVEDVDDAQALRIAEAALTQAREVVRVLEAFIKKWRKRNTP